MKTKYKSLGIYIHIPFCIRKCLYCDFLSAPADRQEQENYVKALVCEIDAYCQNHSINEYEVQTVFFGGGTPSLLELEWLQLILNKLKEYFHFSSDVEISLECNPKTANLEKLKGFFSAGINRLSIGLQSANEEELKRLGRLHTYAEFLDTYHWARKAGFQNINVDLMAALPGQSLESYADTVNKVLSLNPEHISAYQLIVEEGTPFYEMYGEEKSAQNFSDILQNKYATVYAKLPDEDTEREMYYLTKKLLHEANYERYEISNYSKPGYECRHNISYWTGVDYIGFGLGASSYVKDFRYNCIQNLSDYEKCCRKLSKDYQEKKIYENIHQLHLKDKMEEFMYLGLRLTKGVLISEFQERFGQDIFSVYSSAIEKMVQQKLLISESQLVEGRIYLTEKGLDLANYVMAEFLLDEE